MDSPIPDRTTSSAHREWLKRNLYALSSQEGNYGLLSIDSVLVMLEVRDERIRDLSEYQHAVITAERLARRTDKAVR